MRKKGLLPLTVSEAEVLMKIAKELVFVPGVFIRLTEDERLTWQDIIQAANHRVLTYTPR